MPTGLTPRQREVLALVALGYSSGAIAERLGLSTRTVEMHRRYGMRMIGASSRVEVVRWAFSHEHAEDSPLMMLVADEDARLTDASRAACRELGFKRQELVCMSVPEIVVDRQLAETRYAEYLSVGQQHGTITLRRKNGSTFDASYSATIRQSPDGARHVSILIPHG